MNIIINIIIRHRLKHQYIIMIRVSNRRADHENFRLKEVSKKFSANAILNKQNKGPTLYFLNFPLQSSRRTNYFSYFVLLDFAVCNIQYVLSFNRIYSQKIRLFFLVSFS